MIDVTRLFGFAFANADLLVEIDADAIVHFAAGATLGVLEGPAEQLMGQPCGQLFKLPDAYRLATVARALGPGGRLGPIRLTLANDEPVDVTLCHLAINPGRISCTLIHPGARAAINWGADTTGLPERNGFITAAKAALGGGETLTLVDVPQLPEIVAGRSSADAERLLLAIGDAIKSIGATAAGRVSSSAFGVVGKDASMPEALVKAIEGVADANGIADLVIHKIVVPLEQGGLTPHQSLIALQHVIQRFIDGKIPDGESTTLAEAFDSAVEETLKSADASPAIPSNSKMRLAFRPVVELKSGKTLQYSVVPTWPEGSVPGASPLAEGTGIADAGELEILAKAIREIEDDRESKFRLCVTLSASAIASPALVALLTGVLERKKDFAKRLQIEIAAGTELTGLPDAEATIKNIRKLGYRVGLANFGESGSSLSQLQSITPDYVKFHPSLLVKVKEAQGDDALLKSLVQSCEKLKIETCADGIEDYNALKRAKDIRFKLGTGEYFGKPVASITTGMAA